MKEGEKSHAYLSQIFTISLIKYIILQFITFCLGLYSLLFIFLTRLLLYHHQHHQFLSFLILNSSYFAFTSCTIRQLFQVLSVISFFFPFTSFVTRNKYFYTLKSKSNVVHVLLFPFRLTQLSQSIKEYRKGINKNRASNNNLLAHFAKFLNFPSYLKLSLSFIMLFFKQK